MKVKIIFQNDNGWAISHMDVDLSGIDRADWQTAIVRVVNAQHPMGCGSTGKYRVEWPSDFCSYCHNTGWVVPKTRPSRFPVSADSVGRKVRCPRRCVTNSTQNVAEAC